MGSRTTEATETMEARIEGGGMNPVQNDAMLRYGAAALALVSQAIHLWVLQEEFVFRPLSGGLIFLVAVCQGFLAASLVFGPGKWMVRFGILLNASAAISWVATRFVGAPTLLGFASLPVEPLNLVAFAAEVALLILLFKMRRGHRATKDSAIPNPEA